MTRLEVAVKSAIVIAAAPSSVHAPPVASTTSKV